MRSSTIDNTARHIRDRILEAEGGRVHLILLFGSRPRGRDHAGSDYDVLVVLHDPVEDWAEEQVRLSVALADIRPHVDIHVYGEAEFFEERDVPGTVAYPATRQGIPLYENA
jgi:predicted nucleotidyltransferase